MAGVLAQRAQTLLKAAEIQSGAMTVPEKRAALKALAAEAKAGVGQHPGEAVAEGYFRQNGMGWLRELERGKGVRVGTSGWVESVELK